MAVSLPPPVGGGEKMMELLLNSQKINKEFNIRHIDISDHRGNWNRKRIDFVNIYTALKSAILTWINVIRFSPDLIYFSIARNNTGIIRDFSLMLLPIFLKKSILAHLHGSYFYEFYKSSPFIIRKIIDFLIPKLSGVIVHTPRLKYNFSRWLEDSRIFCVPNGIADPVKEFSLKEMKNPITLLYMGNLNKSKGYHIFLESIKLLVESGYKVKGIMAGEWINKSEQDYGIRLVKDCNLDTCVKFVGIVKGQEKSNIFNQSHIFVLPSNGEGQPLVLLEAMAYGFPIIATDRGAIKDCVINRENGFIVERNSYKVAESVKYLIDNPQIYRKMSIKSRKLYKNNFTEKHFIDGMTKVFEANMR